MNILFATEVFPIRNSFTEHSLVAREFLVNIATILHDKRQLIDDARLYCNSQIFELLTEDNRRLLPSVLCSSTTVSNAAKKALKNWSVEGLKSWNEYVDAEGVFAQVLTAELLNIHADIFSYDMIVCWGENGVYQKVAQQLEIPCFHVELSSTRSPFFEGRVVDPMGANGSASYRLMSADDPAFRCMKSPPVDFWPAYYSIKGEGNPEEVGFDDSAVTYWQEDRTLEIFRDGKRKTALIGLQLFDDANTQRYSEFDSPKNFLESTIPKLVEDGWSVIVKTHPGAVHRPINFIKQNEALKFAEKFENCHIYSESTDSRNYLLLLKSVDLVVVINSSLGFEAALLGKPVVVCGEAIFKIPGVFPTLDYVLSKDWCQESYLQKLSPILYFFSKYVFIPRDVLTKPDYYVSLKEYWSTRKNEIMAGEFSPGYYMKSFDHYSKNFLSDGETDISDFRKLIPTYLQGLPGSGGEIVRGDNRLLFSQDKSYLSIVEGVSEYRIENIYKTDKEFYVSGWAYCRSRGVPPVMLIIFAEDKLLHIGRLGVKRDDVCEVFDVSNQFTGFKFLIPIGSGATQVCMGFVYSNNSVEVIEHNF